MGLIRAGYVRAAYSGVLNFVKPMSFDRAQAETPLRGKACFLPPTSATSAHTHRHRILEGLFQRQRGQGTAKVCLLEVSLSNAAYVDGALSTWFARQSCATVRGVLFVRLSLACQRWRSLAAVAAPGPCPSLSLVQVSVRGFVPGATPFRFVVDPFPDLLSLRR